VHTFVNVFSVVLAVGFLLIGLAKLVGVEAIAESARMLGISRRMHVTAALLEIAAAVGLTAGIWWPPLRVAAAAGLTVLLGIAVAYHVRAGDKAMNTATPALLAVLTLAAGTLSLTTSI
jgi:DoxX-like protein